MNRFRAEPRKIWTIRSTYALLLVMTALCVGLVSFYVIGFRNVERAERNSDALLAAIQLPFGFVALIIGIIAIISVGHEYRYNTILYSLTSARRRLGVLASKFTALTATAAAIGAVMFGLTMLGFYAGQQLAGVNTIDQIMPDWDFIWRMMALVMAYMTLSFVIAVIFRSLIAAIAIFLVVPTTVESLLILLLKDNTKYLPFTAIGNLTDPGNSVPVTTSALVVIGYVVVLSILAVVLFQRRDAN